MILPDINILVYAHRAESPLHGAAARKLKKMAEGFVPFALTGCVCSGFLRIVTNHRIFVEPTPLETALRFLENLMKLKNCRLVEPADRHWEIFSALVREVRATGNLISDAYLAAVATENGCTLLTADADFRKFVGLGVEGL